jgi:hypothetical protein
VLTWISNKTVNSSHNHQFLDALALALALALVLEKLKPHLKIFCFFCGFVCF